MWTAVTSHRDVLGRPNHRQKLSKIQESRVDYPGSFQFLPETIPGSGAAAVVGLVGKSRYLGKSLVELLVELRSFSSSPSRMSPTVNL